MNKVRFSEYKYKTICLSISERWAFQSCLLVCQNKACKEPETYENQCSPYVLYPL